MASATFVFNDTEPAVEVIARLTALVDGREEVYFSQIEQVGEFPDPLAFGLTLVDMEDPDGRVETFEWEPVDPDSE